MFNNNAIKSLILVCNDKTKEYGNLLKDILSECPIINENRLSIKVDAVIWTPKQYIDNEASMSNDNYVLFIGKFKEAKDRGKYIKFMIDKFGMYYGWLGKKAVMFAEEKALKNKDYKDFLTFIEGLNTKFKNRIERFSDYDKTLKPINGLAVAASVTASAFIPFGVPIVAGIALHNGIKQQNLIKDLQYRSLIQAFYLDSLQTFLEE